jgi:Arc/MetJ family transcription regulator
MRTTVEIPDRLMHEAMQTAHVKTKTMAIVLGLRELINRHKLDMLRELRGRVPLTTNVTRARGRALR